MTARDEQAAPSIADFPARYARTARFSLGSPRNLTVTGGGRRVLFCRSSAADDPVLSLWSYDLDTDEERLLVDPTVLGAVDDDLPPAERARRERARESASGIVAYSVDGDGTRCCFALAGALFVVDIADGRLSAPATTGSVFDPRLNRQGTAVAYSDRGTLRLCTLAHDGTATDAELRADDDPLVSHGRAEFVAAEEMQRSHGSWWAPDGSCLLATRVDENPVWSWWIADPAHPERPPSQVRYPAAGSANATVELELVGLNGSARRIEWDDGGRFEYLADVIWQAGHHPLIVRQTRDQRLLSIAELRLGEPDDDGLPAVDGAIELYSIADDVWVELHPGAPRWCSAGLLTIEDRDGARRLVLGGEPLSDAGLNVRSIVGVRSSQTDRPEAEEGGSTAADDRDEAVVVSAWTEPSEIHLFELPLPSSGLTERRLTDAPGVHAGALGGATLAVTSSVPDRPGSEVTVTDLTAGATSRVAAIIDRSAEPGFDAAPAFITLGPDRLESALFVPADHDGRRALPVLLDPYGGPHAQRVLKTHNPHLVSRWFAESGYAVLVTDGRGTPGRGPAWERAVWGDLAGPVLDDQVAALDAALDRHGFLDGSRVAIRGWSFGGYLAALAVLRRPDRFHAAIAGAPVTTWHLYDTHYTERYLGHPDRFPEHYDRSDLWTEDTDGPRIQRLQRPLLLIHGLADDNVVAAHTLRFSTALLATGSPHRVLPLSGVTHMTPQEAVAENLLRLQLDFLDETIGGAK